MRDGREDLLLHLSFGNSLKKIWLKSHKGCLQGFDSEAW